jgi:hypothetical protein
MATNGMSFARPMNNGTVTPLRLLKFCEVGILQWEVVLTMQVVRTSEQAGNDYCKIN